MVVLPYLYLFFTFTSWMLFMTLNYLYNVIRSFYWRYTGVYQQVIASQKPENYKTSAHVKKILFKHTIEMWIKHPESSFLTVHEGFVNPERLLNDDCSLYAVTPTEAIFIKVKKRPDDIFKYDFFRVAQFCVADKLITLPLNQFNRLAENMEKDEEASIVFLHNQTRCGGSLVTALFRETGRCVSFNEPTCLSSVCRHIFTDNIWHGATARRLFKNTVCLLCKPYRALGEKVSAYVIKPIAPDMVSVEMIQEVFPEAIQFFIYRNPLEVAASLRRVGEVIAPIKLVCYLPNMSNVVALVGDFLGIHNREFRGWTCAVHPEFELGYRETCITVYHYLEALKRGIDIHGVRYEDLVDHKIEMIKAIFEVCRLPQSFTEKAREAMSKDSQANSTISREKLKAALPNPPKPPPQFLDVARLMSEEFGVPGPETYQDKTFRLPNTLEP